MDLRDLQAWADGAMQSLGEREAAIAKEPLPETSMPGSASCSTCGLDHLTLDRPARSLSGGEAQRIRLATQIGSKLTGVLYILDEPSIGLHQRDNQRLIDSLKTLRDVGNTVIVVEHDEDMMQPGRPLSSTSSTGAGKHGGHVVAQGPPTASHLAQAERNGPVPGRPQAASPFRPSDGRATRKETLPDEAPPATTPKAWTSNCPWAPSSASPGSVAVARVPWSTRRSTLPCTTISTGRPSAHSPSRSSRACSTSTRSSPSTRAPLGARRRSNPATYTGVFNEIRNLFTQLPEAKIRGYKPGRFSFNVVGGRCETCKGAGLRTLEMNFLPDVHVPCEDCGGKRYNRETVRGTLPRASPLPMCST